MFQKTRSKNQFSFDIKIFNNKSKKNFKTNSINLRDIRDIFIHKQDVYLIKLLEKRIKLTKMLQSKSPHHNMIKLINPWPFPYNQNPNKTAKNLLNKKLHYKNIKIKKVKVNKKENENISLINYEKDKNNTLNYFDNLITSKIYNSDITKNNKNLVKIISKSKRQIYNYSYAKKNFFKTRYNINNNNNSLIHLPKINKNKNSQTLRNNRNIINIKDSFSNYKTIIFKVNESNGNSSDIIFPEKGFFQDNKKNGDIVLKKIMKDNYNNIYKDRSISPIRNQRYINIE